MKQTLTLLFGLLLMTNLSNAQIIQKGSSCLQLGYGYPSAMQLLGSVFKFTVNTDDAEASSEFKYKGLGPVHLRYDYMVGGRVGIGLSANMELGNFKFTNSYKDIDDNYVTSVTNFNYSSVNAMARMNVHFIKNAEKVDVYYGFGVGYSYTRVKLEETLTGNIIDPAEQQDINDFNNYLNSVFKLFPVAVEEVFGLKAPIRQNAGIYFEVGYSKALAQIGFFVKLSEPKGFNSGNWKWF